MDLARTTPDGTPRIVILGAGAFGREVLDIVEAQNKLSKKWEVLGFLDERPSLHGQVVNGYRVLGFLETIRDTTGWNAVCAIGDNRSRKRTVEAAQGKGLEFVNLIHPSAVLTERVTLGKGVVITAGCVLTNNIDIRDHAILNLASTVGHDAKIGAYCQLCPGARVSGRTTLGEGVFLGTGAITLPGISIGEWSIIGAGAVVADNVPANVTAVGIPARIVKKNPTVN